MNTVAVKQEIDNIISTIKNIRQYPTSKAQDTQLKELGIYELMPLTQVKNGRRFIGYTDAAVVIEAATTAKTAVMNAYGEGEEIGASKLYTLLNEKDEQVITVENDTETTINNVAVRVYRNALWIDGGDNDDILVRSIDELRDSDTVQIKLSKRDIEKIATLAY